MNFRKQTGRFILPGSPIGIKRFSFCTANALYVGLSSVYSMHNLPQYLFYRAPSHREIGDGLSSSEMQKTFFELGIFYVNRKLHP